MGLIKGETERYANKIPLEPGEELVTAARVVHNTKDVGIFGAVVNAADAALEKNVQNMPAGSTAGDAPRKGVLLWALTTERMLFFTASTVTGTKLRASFPINDVRAVTATKAKVRYGKLTLAFRDGSQIVYDLRSDREALEITERARSLLGAD